MRIGKDLGTYHVRVELEDGRGFIYEWATSRRYMRGNGGIYPLGADEIRPTWETEDEVLSGIQYMFFEGNYSCDCNKRLFLARAAHEDEPEDIDCGDTLPIKSLVVTRPDGTTVTFTPESKP